MPNRTILIVDDSRIARMKIRQSIRRLRPEWNLVVAEDPDHALEMVGTVEDIDCMLVDFNMPQMDGLELIGKLRESFPNALYALLTANIQKSIRARAEDLDVHFISKPPLAERLEEFFARVA